MMNENKERIVIAKLLADAELRRDELRIILEKLEEKEFGFNNMFDHLCDYKTVKGQIIENARTIKTLLRCLEQLDEQGWIVFEHEIPF